MRVSDATSVLLRALSTGVGWVLFLVGSCVWGLVIIPVTLLALGIHPNVQDGFNRLTHAALELYIRVLPFLRLEIERRGLAGSEPRILVVNHQSWLDPIVMLGLEPGSSGPARAYLFRVPVVRSVLKLARFYVGEAGEPAPMPPMRAGADATRAGGSALLFFPEGTRSKDGEIGKFRRGAFRLAVEHGLPIQPVLIEGLGDVLPPGAFIAQRPGRTPVRVRYLEPRRPPYGDGPMRRVVRELTDEVRRTMIAEQRRLRDERPAKQS